MLGLAVNAVQSNALIMLEFDVNAVQSNATSLWLRKMQLTSIFTAVLLPKYMQLKIQLRTVCSLHFADNSICCQTNKEMTG
jgi:hypothetical protein